MNNEFLEGVLYDWHNDFILGHQNKDIIFYKKYILQNNIKNVLVVGAGTGRVAIPISSITQVSALDISLGRLIRLSEHNDRINIIACDFLKYKSRKKYDLIIFPYSTIQAINRNKYFILLKKIKKLLSKNGKCLVDYDSSFNNVSSSNKKIKCEGYCKRIGKYVIEYDIVNKFSNRIEVIREFVIENEVVTTLEKWFVFNEKEFKKLLLNNNLYESKKILGYGGKSSKHKVIIEIVKND